MPISEDEYESHRHGQGHQNGLSKAELRRSNKPIMEKRRRARINHCLNELKTLILDALKKDPARHSKLEKADILEMTVKHLQNIQKQQLAVAVASDPNVVQKFKTGFSECAAEVTRYISGMEGIESGVKQRLANHLNSCVGGVKTSGMNLPLGEATTIPLRISQGNGGMSIQTGSPEDVNNNGRVHVPTGIQLIPSRLPTGELALLVPNSQLPFFQVERNPSAFTHVRPSRASETPLSPASTTPSDYEDRRTPSPKQLSSHTPLGPNGPPLGFHVPVESPPQHLQVSSTSISPENKIGPLSVITNYPRKRTQQDGLLTLAPVPKQSRYSDEVIVISSSSSPDQVQVGRPSTSGGQGSSSSEQDMWRPW